MLVARSRRGESGSMPSGIAQGWRFFPVPLAPFVGIMLRTGESKLHHDVKNLLEVLHIISNGKPIRGFAEFFGKVLVDELAHVADGGAE